MDVSDSQFILDLRRRLQANKDAGKPEAEGIDTAELRRMVSILQANRTTIALKTHKAAKAKAPKVEAFSDDELNSLFN